MRPASDVVAGLSGLRHILPRLAGSHQAGHAGGQGHQDRPASGGLRSEDLHDPVLSANADVVTIEGLSPDGSHPVQQAWEELDVPQCGYCQPGIIMSVVALLNANPTPDDADIDAGLTNICRCGTFNRVRRGIHLAAGRNRHGSKP